MNRQFASTQPGRLVAKALRHSWRSSIGNNFDLAPADFEAVMPLLYDSGAAGLGWWRIRESELRETPSGELLHQAFRLLTLQAAIHETKIQKAVCHLRANHVEPIVIKGWAIARRYPLPGLRPYGDIDLIIRREQYPIASRLV